MIIIKRKIHCLLKNRDIKFRENNCNLIFPILDQTDF